MNSDVNGCTVFLCRKHHNEVHKNREMDLRLKQLCQREFEKTHSREEFMALFRRNYLD